MNWPTSLFIGLDSFHTNCTLFYLDVFLFPAACGEACSSDGGQSALNGGAQQEAEGPKEKKEEGPKRTPEVGLLVRRFHYEVFVSFSWCFYHYFSR